MKPLREPLFPLSKGGTANVTQTFRQRLKFLAPLLLLLLAVWCILSPAGAFAANAPNPNPRVLPPNSLAAHDGTSYRAKVFASDDSGNSVSATFNCSSTSLSGSFFYQTANEGSFYGDMAPTTCSLTQSPNGTCTPSANGTWKTTVTTGVKVESSPGTGATGTIALQFQCASGGHNFTTNTTNTSCTDPSVICVMLMLTSFSGTSIHIPDFSGGTSATLLLSVRK
jgi:hypothetical protein